MKTRLSFLCFLVASFLMATAATRAETTATPEPVQELYIVVVDNLQTPRGAITDFDRIDMAFQKVAKQRKWPVKVIAERFAANTAPHPLELRVYNQPLRQESPGDLTFRGWMTLTVGETKHDFGVLKHQYYRRAGEATDDVLDKVFLGAANVAADKIQPILFPQLGGSKS